MLIWAKPPHNSDQVQEVEQILGAPLPVQGTLKSLNLKETKKVINTLNPQKAPAIDLITATI